METRTAAAAPAATPDEVTGRLADQLLRLSRRLHRSQRELMEPLGITLAQARLLRALALYDEPPRMADLAQRLDVVPRAVTTLVDALEERELLRRVPDPHNRRVIRIELRERGGQALLDLRQARRTAAAELLGPLSDGQRAELTALLSVLDEQDAHPAGPRSQPPRPRTPVAPAVGGADGREPGAS
ncbi:MarR family winged helix-turn-helix transcriptional regulator [Actinacidiphila sp. ITFR-21]|uniref:MarR family winged helix-turn-helix transcriptional regulator n=1 Tax=Actinacidiphila sp. ITFR-21 TaxID=3075199 RepID=UPI00288B8864|nr:MarR family transcriptional regulator [Streptomyces sp. ITFR-21]WNI19095.1 MarR family transcriptional regulator [Streptomyces sp. ITFR-21]